MSRILKRSCCVVPALALLIALAGAETVSAGEHRIGLGIHYWETLDDLDVGSGLEEDGVSFLLSYQYKPERGLLRFAIDLEYFDDGFGGSPDSALAPVAYIVVGGAFYVAGGVGVTFSSGLVDDVSDPFYAARLGYQLDLLPGLALDVNANYRTNAFEELDNFDVDTITLGAIVRLKL